MEQLQSQLAAAEARTAAAVREVETLSSKLHTFAAAEGRADAAELDLHQLTWQHRASEARASALEAL